MIEERNGQTLRDSGGEFMTAREEEGDGRREMDRGREGERERSPGNFFDVNVMLFACVKSLVDVLVIFVSENFLKRWEISENYQNCWECWNCWKCLGISGNVGTFLEMLGHFWKCW